MYTFVGNTQLCVICLQHILAHMGHYHWVNFGSTEGLHVWLQKQYSRIPFMQHPWDWMDAGLSNIVDYWMGHILTQVLTSNFFFVYLGSTTDQRSNPCGYLLHLLIQGHQGPFLYFLDLLQFVRDAEWRGRLDQESSCLQKLLEWEMRYLNGQHTYALGGVSLSMCLRSASAA
jgi:hypothetical protein